MDLHYSSKTAEWYTPPVIIEPTVALFGSIDLDPCSDSGFNIPASLHYTESDDGLSKPWMGKVYMNPPYGRSISLWTNKLLGEYAVGNATSAIALLPSRTDTKWFRSLGEFPKCFVSGRLTFSNAPHPAPFPSVIVYLGKEIQAFAKAFGHLGDVYAKL